MTIIWMLQLSFGFEQMLDPYISSGAICVPKIDMTSLAFTLPFTDRAYFSTNTIRLHLDILSSPRLVSLLSSVSLKLKYTYSVTYFKYIIGVAKC